MGDIRSCGTGSRSSAACRHAGWRTSVRVTCMFALFAGGQAVGKALFATSLVLLMISLGLVSEIQLSTNLLNIELSRLEKKETPPGPPACAIAVRRRVGRAWTVHAVRRVLKASPACCAAPSQQRIKPCLCEPRPKPARHRRR